MSFNSQSGHIKKRQWIGSQSSFNWKRLKLASAGQFPTFELFLEESLSIEPFQHHPNISGNTTALEDLADPAKNDVLSNTGSSVHGAHIASVLYKFFFSPPSPLDDLDIDNSLRQKIQDWTEEEKYSCFEALTILYAKDSTIGRIESQMSGNPVPTNDEGMKAAADAFRAKLWYCTTIYDSDQIAAFYERIINATLFPALSDFHSQFSSITSKHYLWIVNRSRNAEFKKTSPRQEETFSKLFRSRAPILIYNPLQSLKIPQEDQPIRLNNDNEVIGPCRPILHLGTLLYKSATAVKCDDLFPSHRSAEEGGSELRAAICRLASSRSAVILCAQWAGLHRSGRETFSDDKLPSIFFVAVAKLWLRDPVEFWDIMDEITLPTVWFSNKALSAAGIRFNLIIPDNEDTNNAEVVDADGEDAYTF